MYSILIWCDHVLEQSGSNFYIFSSGEKQTADDFKKELTMMFNDTLRREMREMKRQHQQELKRISAAFNQASQPLNDTNQPSTSAEFPPDRLYDEVESQSE